MSGRRGESVYDSRDVVRGPSFGGMGHRMSIVGPHAAAVVIDDDDDDDDDRRRSGGASCPPPPVRPVPPDTVPPDTILTDVARHCRCR